MSSYLLQILYKVAMLQSELVNVWVTPQGICHEVKVQLEY